MTLPMQDGKMMDQQRFVVGGPQVRVLSGGMKIATIPSVSSEARIIKSEIDKPATIQTATNVVASSPQNRPIKVIQARPMGVLTPNKIQQLLPSSPGGKVCSLHCTEVQIQYSFFFFFSKFLCLVLLRTKLTQKFS